MTEESKTLPVLQTDTNVQDARKGDDAHGFDGAVKRARHVNRAIIRRTARASRLGFCPIGECAEAAQGLAQVRFAGLPRFRGSGGRASGAAGGSRV
jgi:hypothetical protein